MSMNNIYIYNNDFNSLLNLITILLRNNIRPYNIKNNNYNSSLLDNLIYLEIGNKQIISFYLKYLGLDNFKIIYYVFLSNSNNKELIIFYYLLNFQKYKSKTLFMRNLKCVSEALRIAKYVSRENHRFKGFIRFKEINNKVLYAEISPENNILVLLSKHFKTRLNNDFWIIKDVKRGILSIYDKNKYYIFSEDELELLDINLSDKETYYEELWKNFYETIGIKERKNERCRMNFMPKKYWKYITEVSELVEKSS